ncbi:T9SS type A sorting domain-containing protein, partial [candidate division KSB1 bacterium]|nr:T9SS type A sorting domain-containing protein [candidate division KSB1 bacterium]
YVWPEANGVHLVNGGWDTSINKEYIFERCRVWLNKYFGPDHGITFGVTETGIKPEDANIAAVWYASTLGEFTKHGVELFTPWSWKKGMWEVLHLFAKYHQDINVSSMSSNEEYVSAYSAVSETGDTLSIVLVNKSVKNHYTANVTLQNCDIPDGKYTVLLLNDLPASETFVSHNNNALKPGTVQVNNNAFEINLPPLSIAAVQLNGNVTNDENKNVLPNDFKLVNFPNPFKAQTTLYFTLPYNNSPVSVLIFDVRGRQVYAYENAQTTAGQHKLNLDASTWSSGIYMVQLMAKKHSASHKILLVK